MSVSPITSSKVMGPRLTIGENMACYYPMDVPYTIGEFDGKKHLNWSLLKSFKKRSAFEKFKEACERGETDYQITQVPCGKCIGCRLDYSRQWATRCMLEAHEHKDNQFITLTYADEYLTKNPGVDVETGELTEIATLMPEELTKFMKDLRRYYKYHYNHDNIRFYACGEYGSLYQRPHFHIICFNLPVFDKEYLFSNENHDKIYTSEIIGQIWGKGHVTIGDVTWNSAAYTARYVMKKLKGPEAKELYKKMGKVPEFVRMSRKEGIARKYYEDNKDKIYENDEIILTNKKGTAQVVKPCKYYDKLYDIDNHEFMEKLKARRADEAKEAMRLQLEKTSLNLEEYLKVKEANKMAQIKTLTRKVE